MSNKLRKQDAHSRPQLGEWREFAGRADRTFSGTRFLTTVTWISVPINPTRGLYVGYRKVFDGAIEEDDDGRSVIRWFTRSGTREVWLFAVNPRQKPLLVLPEDVL